MKTDTSLLICLILLFVTLGASGQTPSAPHAPNNPLPQWVYDRVQKSNDTGWLRPGVSTSGPASVNPRNKDFPRRQIDPEVLVARETIRKMLMPPASYFETYADFLKRDKNGIFRIFADTGCDKGLAVSVEELGKCVGFIPIKGGGSLFSFRFRSHLGYGADFWDLHMIDGKFVAGNDSVESLIAEIGDVNIAAVNLKTKPFSEFAAYKPKDSTSAIRGQNICLAAGESINGHTFTNSVPAKLNSVYAMRIVAYHVPAKANGIMGKIRFPGRGLDIRLAFKVVGQEEDGSLVVIWKELKRDLPRRELKD